MANNDERQPVPDPIVVRLQAQVDLLREELAQRHDDFVRENGRLQRENGRLELQLNLANQRYREATAIRSSLLQGELIKAAMKDAQLWESFLREDAEWASLPVEMRNFIRSKLETRNHLVHPTLEVPNVED